MNKLNLSLALFLSVLVHLGLAFGYSNNDATDITGAIDSGEEGVEIGLGMAGSYTDSFSSRPEPIVEKDAQEESSPEREYETAQESPLANKSHTNPEKIPEEQKLTSADIAVAAPPPKQEPIQAKHAQVSEKTKLLPEAKKVKYMAQVKPAQQHSAPALQKASGRENHNKSGAKKGKTKQYYRELITWLRQYKRYPALLKKQKKEGIVTVKFTIDRNGYVLFANIVKNSSHPELDQAALDVLSNASPLPAMPDWMDRQQLTLAIPIEYSLITNTSYKE